MKVLADECLEPKVVNELRRLGHDVLWLREKNTGMSDSDVAKLALAEGRIVLSYDVKFASDTRQSSKPHPGFVIARLGKMPHTEIAAQFNVVLLSKRDWENRIAVIKPSGVRHNP